MLYREARVALIKIHTRDNNVKLTQEDWNSLADKTEGYSGSDIANMTLGALFGPIRDLRTAQFWKRNVGMKEFSMASARCCVLKKCPNS